MQDEETPGTTDDGTGQPSPPGPGPLLRGTPGPVLDKRSPNWRSRPRRLFMDRLFRITSGLHSDQPERDEHLAAIRSAIRSDGTWELHAWLHENLSILDSKANAILAVNSLGVATLTFLYSTFDRLTPPVLVIGVAVAAAFLLWSILPLARIAFVYWSTTEEFRNPAKLLDELLLVRDKRTAIVRSSLVKDAFALAVFALALALSVADRWL
ncbi:MAG TPA: hypothetical protein VKG45_10060 [Actinomycetes bacterium]|nr:hypothetical protein [Actinomycetes bacterium]